MAGAAAVRPMLEAGIRQLSGQYPAGTVNDQVDRRLRQLAELQRDFNEKSGRGEK